MIKIKIFAFNPLQVNGFVLYDETRECILIDPACFFDYEQEELVLFIEQNNLNPKLILNTHAHFDHIMGNKFCSEKYNIKIGMHNNDIPLYTRSSESAELFGMSVDDQPEPTISIKNNEIIRFGNSELKALLAPGHSPGSLLFCNNEQKIVFSGDVLFHESIGRTDLPGGDMDTLLNSINDSLMSLNDETTVYTGHGPETNIGFERRTNPFINNYF